MLSQTFTLLSASLQALVTGIVWVFGALTHQQREDPLLDRRILFIPKDFSRVWYNSSIFPRSLQEGTGLGLPHFSAVRCQLPQDGEQNGPINCSAVFVVQDYVHFRRIFLTEKGIVIQM